jgi:hypothetical protein
MEIEIIKTKDSCYEMSYWWNQLGHRTYISKRKEGNDHGQLIQFNYGL